MKAPEETPKKQKIVTLKDYPARNLIVGLFALPLLVLLSGIFIMSLMLYTEKKIFIVVSLVVTLIAELCVVWWGLWYTDKLPQAKKYLGLDHFSLKGFLTGIAVGAILLLALQLLAAGLAQLHMPIQSSDTSTNLGKTEGALKVLVLLVLVPFVVPFMEELLFRGLIFTQMLEAKYTQKNPVFWATLVSAICFSLAHFQGFSTVTDFFLLAWIFFTAVCFAGLRYKFHSLWASFGAHMSYNLLTALLAFFTVLT